MSVPPGCSASCASVTTNLVPTCGVPVVEGRVLTNVVYFLLRMLATMALACVFIILDAQTIQVMTKIYRRLEVSFFANITTRP